MDKAEHGRLLREAMTTLGVDNQAVADYTGSSLRTVGNWRGGRTMPEPPERRLLRELLPGYDTAGDAVERAIRNSELAEFRKSRVLAAYQEALHEERRESAI